VAVCILALAAGACASGAPYHRPEPPQTPPAFKENADWKVAQPADQAARGPWWEIFHDPQLNTLESQIDVSNLTLRVQQARFLQARAALAISRSGRQPEVTLTPRITRGTQAGSRANATAHETVSDFLLPVDVAYEADLWGRIRQTIESSRAAAQASAADLEAVRLSLHAELALDYFELRSLDAERALLDNSVGAFQRALELTQNRFAGGIASQADVALAETELYSTRAQAVDLGARRAALEHAIAVLVGKAPAALQLGAAPILNPPPEVPPGLASDLLERRPDIAAAERRVAAAAADLGVASAAFFPRLLLTATAGFEGRSLGSWLSGLSTFWSAGPAMALTLFDGGRRRAVKAQAQFGLDESVASYQDVILQSLREVEDNLASLRILREEADIQAAAIAAAERSVTLSTNRYRGGVSSYLEVIIAQNAALNNQRAAVSILSRRLAASVLLIKALGGGWDPASLPSLKTGSR
jgi:NodT family efflux transporter outer membrane factor (OMF) lipoprotein